MTVFTTSRNSVATLGADRDVTWAALTDPGLLAALTPFLRPGGVGCDRAQRFVQQGEHGDHDWPGVEPEARVAPGAGPPTGHRHVLGRVGKVRRRA